MCQEMHNDVHHPQRGLLVSWGTPFVSARNSSYSGVPQRTNPIGSRTVGYPFRICPQQLVQWGTPTYEPDRLSYSGVPRRTNLCVCVWVHVPVCDRVSVSWCVRDIDWVVVVFLRRVLRRCVLVVSLCGVDAGVLCVVYDAVCGIVWLHCCNR